MNKFELSHKMLAKVDPMVFKKKKSSDSVETEGEKENYEVANSWYSITYFSIIIDLWVEEGDKKNKKEGDWGKES